MEHPDCYTCRKHQGEEPVPGGPIYEDAYVYASHVAPPPGGRAYLGYCFVELRRHASSLADLTVEEAHAIGRLVAHLSRALMAELGVEHVYAFVVSDQVPHLHFCLVPRHPGTPPQYWGTRIDEWPEAPQADEVEIADLVARLRERIRDEGLLDNEWRNE